MSQLKQIKEVLLGVSGPNTTNVPQAPEVSESIVDWAFIQHILLYVVLFVVFLCAIFLIFTLIQHVKSVFENFLKTTIKEELINALKTYTSPAQAGSTKAITCTSSREITELKGELKRIPDAIKQLIIDTASRDLETLKEKHEKLQSDKLNSDSKIVKLEKEINDKAIDKEKVDKLLSDEKEKNSKLLNEIDAAFIHFLPKWIIKDSEQFSDARAFYDGVINDDPRSLLTWSILCAFLTAHNSSVSSEYLLQITRQLGVSLVDHFKSQPNQDIISRHRNLCKWAELINLNSSGRFALVVPSLNATINRTKMACSTSASVVNDVLCWQVCNPDGSSFSFAVVE
jgi:hypothetical protein